MKVKIPRGKFERLNACCDEHGVIAALAVDHRGNLLEAIAQARGAKGTASATDMLAFKKAVTKVLTVAARASSKPFIFLSAGVSDDVFCEMLELVAEAGVKYSGVLCGRATWQQAI